jgi:hypothetical protein
MAETTLRDMIIAIVPPWLQDDTGNALLRSIGMVLDALGARTVEGVKLRFPEVASPTALGYIGNDRLLERGPNQSHVGYAAQLVRAIETWQNAGGGRTILSQLRAYYAPDNGPTMRLVIDGTTTRDYNIWHEIAPVTGYVTRTEVNPADWKWGLDRRWYGWAIVDVTGRWSIDHWGDPGDWGDGGVWGSNITQEEAQGLNSILKKWMPAPEQGQIILTFSPSTFTRTSLDHPNGTGYTTAWQAAQAANFFTIQGI